MKILFAGTPEFALPSLTALIQSQHEVLAVYTQPDRLAGRGLKLTASPVKLLAQQHAILLEQPTNLKEKELQQKLASYEADLMVVIAYGLILPKSVLAIPRFGCINVHASLLPFWRGAAPIQRAILAGDRQTGISIMQMNEKLDAGDILLRKLYDLQPADTAQEVHDKLAQLGAAALIETLTEMENGKLKATPQNNALATYAHKLNKTEAAINWQQSAESIARAIRAYHPWPVAYTAYKEKNLRIWQAVALSETSPLPPGSLIKLAPEGIDIATGLGQLRILKLQLPGGNPKTAKDFINAEAKAWRVGDIVFK